MERKHQHVSGIPVPSHTLRLRRDGDQRVNLFLFRFSGIGNSRLVFHLQQGIRIHARRYGSPSRRHHFAVGNHVKAGGHLVLLEKFNEQVVVLGKQLVSFHKGDYRLAESRFRNN